MRSFFFSQDNTKISQSQLMALPVICTSIWAFNASPFFRVRASGTNPQHKAALKDAGKRHKTRQYAAWGRNSRMKPQSFSSQSCKHKPSKAASVYFKLNIHTDCCVAGSGTLSAWWFQRRWPWLPTFGGCRPLAPCPELVMFTIYLSTYLAR